MSTIYIYMHIHTKITANYSAKFVQVNRHVSSSSYSTIFYSAERGCVASPIGWVCACAVDSTPVLPIFFISLFCFEMVESNSLCSLFPSVFLFFRYFIKCETPSDMKRYPKMIKRRATTIISNRVHSSTSQLQSHYNSSLH